MVINADTSKQGIKSYVWHQEEKIKGLMVAQFQLQIILKSCMDTPQSAHVLSSDSFT